MRILVAPRLRPFGVSDDGEILVIGSQAILAAYSESELPPEATVSIEADIAFFDDSNDEKADQVDGAKGRHPCSTRSSATTGRELDSRRRNSREAGRIVWCLSSGETLERSRPSVSKPHDLVLAKLVAGREKDYEFADAFMGRGLVAPEVLLERVEELPVVGAIKRHVRNFIKRSVDDT